MSTVLFTHPACLKHDAGEYHPERPERLRAILRALETEEFMFLHRDIAPEIDRSRLLLAHPEDYISDILDHMPAEGHRHLDPDTILCPESGEAVLRSAGAVIAAVDAVAKGECRNAFCAVRPPGHHAERDAAMGFCFFANAALGALHAREAYGYEKVAVIDIDVHHGNGTQDIFWDDPNLFYGSTHQRGAFPGGGDKTETGAHNNICNRPINPGMGSLEFRDAYEHGVLPALDAFAPDFLIISAGFDAHVSDPMAHLRVTEADFSWVTKQLLDIAKKHCDNRVVSTLEGGYDAAALASSVASHIRALMEA